MTTTDQQDQPATAPDGVAVVDTSPERIAQYRYLSPHEKRALICALNEREDWTQKDIADRLQVSQSTVSRQLTKAGVLRPEDAERGEAQLEELRRHSLRAPAPSTAVRFAVERLRDALHPLSADDRRTALAIATVTALPEHVHGA